MRINCLWNRWLSICQRRIYEVVRQVSGCCCRYGRLGDVRAAGYQDSGRGSPRNCGAGGASAVGDSCGVEPQPNLLPCRDPLAWIADAARIGKCDNLQLPAWHRPGLVLEETCSAL